MLIISYFTWLPGQEYSNPQPKIVKIYIIGIAVQCLHLGEEYLTDFQKELPQFFNTSWSDRKFLVFILVWLSVFVFAVWGALNKYRISYLIIWFYAIAGGAGNGIFHLLLSLYRGTYFPGLITSFAHLFAGIILLRELISARRRSSQ